MDDTDYEYSRLVKVAGNCGTQEDLLVVLLGLLMGSTPLYNISLGLCVLQGALQGRCFRNYGYKMADSFMEALLPLFSCLL